MEARLLLRLEASGGASLSADAPVHFLCTYCAALPALHDAKVAVMRDMEAWLEHHVPEGPFVPFE